MSLSKITILVFASFAVLSTLLAKLQSIVYIDEEPKSKPAASAESTGIVPTDEFRHLMWFVQVSDLHLSIFQDPGRGPDFLQLCNETLSVISPAVVLATGDLIDAKTSDNLGSKQYSDEWKMYQQALHDSGVTKKTIWLDIRGNHDNFNVLSLDNKDNLFRIYSVQGKYHRRSYSYKLYHDTETYTFIGIDACMDPGPKRPFNFLGILNKEEYSLLQQLSLQSINSNVTIWFGHYPTSVIVAPNPGARELMRHSGPYLCGHLHTLGGLVPQMYTLQNTGVLELELGDWKDNRRYRLVAIDHGLFSFTDHRLGNWPLALVTNPKNALYAMPTIEPLMHIEKSSHIRVLVFSPHAIKVVRVKFMSNIWHNLSNIEGPLFVLPWQPSKFKHGLYTMQVYAEDEAGNEATIDHQFSLDGVRPTFPIGARLALMGHISVGQIIFGVTLVSAVFPLCILRGLHCLGKDHSIRLKSERSFCRRWIFKLYLLSCIDKLFWPLILAALYVAVGPWFIGEIIDGHIGVCFVWGIFIAGTFLPGGLTFFAGTAYLLTFFIPIILAIAHCLYHHFCIVLEDTTPQYGLISYLWRHLVMFLFTIWQTLCAIGYYYSYGTMAFFLGFTHTWSIFFTLALWRIAVTLPESRLNHLGKPSSAADRQVIGEPLLAAEMISKQVICLDGGVNPS